MNLYNLLVENNLNEAVIKYDDLNFVSGKLYATAMKMLLASIKNDRIYIEFPLTRIDNLKYAAKISGHEELDDLIEQATMSKDFTERNKAQRQLQQKIHPVYTWLKENVFNLINGRKPKISRNPAKQFIIEYKTNNPEKPYIKFVRYNDGFKLVSLHDSTYSLKKKFYNDNNSYKFGSKELKHRLQNIKEEIILEAYKLDTPEQVINALKTKQVGVKVNRTFSDLFTTSEKSNQGYINDLSKNLETFFQKCKGMGINNPTYGVQLVLSKSNKNNYRNFLEDDGLFEFLRSYNKPWVKQLPSYQKAISNEYDRATWHNLEKEIQNEQSNHGKKSKGSGNTDDVKILYPKDENGWELKIPLSFSGSKAAAFFGKEGEKQQPTRWCTRVDEGYYNNYTDEGKHPLYIIRNYKTGKAYQVVRTKKVVNFLDQDDVKGDEITKGDLSKIPDKLLSLIKMYGTNKTLLDYKNADDTAGKLPGYRDYRDVKYKEPTEVSLKIIEDWYNEKLRGMSEESKKEFLDSRRVMKAVAKNGAEIPDRSIDNISHYYNTGEKTIYTRKAGMFKYWYKDHPDWYVIINATKSRGVECTDYSGKEVIDLTNIAYIDLGYYKKSLGEYKSSYFAKNETKQHNYQKRLYKIRDSVLAKYQEELEDNGFRTFSSSKEFTKEQLPKNLDYSGSGMMSDSYGMAGRYIKLYGDGIGKNFKGNFSCIIKKGVPFKKENIKISKISRGEDVEVKDEKIKDLAWKIMSTYNKEYRKEFQDVIVGNRQEGNYTTNMYEEVKKFFNY